MKSNEEIKDLEYYRNNCEENYITTPISVLRYIGELENAIAQYKEEVERLKQSVSRHEQDYSDLQNRNLFLKTKLDVNTNIIKTIRTHLNLKEGESIIYRVKEMESVENKLVDALQKLLLKTEYLQGDLIEACVKNGYEAINNYKNINPNKP